MTREDEAARHADNLDWCTECGHPLGPDGPRRIWLLNNAHALPPKNGWLVFRGTDEYGNPTIALRVTPRRYLVVSTARRLRTELWEPDETAGD